MKDFWRCYGRLLVQMEVVDANVIGEGDDVCIEGNVSVPSFIIIDIYFEAPQHR